MKVADIRKNEKQLVVFFKDGTEIITKFFADETENCENSVNTTEKEQEQINRVLEETGKTHDDIAKYKVFHKKKSDEIYLSKHARERLKQRMGWSDKTANRMVTKIYNDVGLVNVKNGRVMSEEEKLKRIAGEVIGGIHYIFYGNAVYVFNNTVLVTVMYNETKKDKKISCIG